MFKMNEDQKCDTIMFSNEKAERASIACDTIGRLPIAFGSARVLAYSLIEQNSRSSYGDNGAGRIDKIHEEVKTHV